MSVVMTLLVLYLVYVFVEKKKKNMRKIWETEDNEGTELHGPEDAADDDSEPSVPEAVSSEDVLPDNTSLEEIPVSETESVYERPEAKPSMNASAASSVMNDGNVSYGGRQTVDERQEDSLSGKYDWKEKPETGKEGKDSKLITDKKKLIIYSEILKAKYLE